MARAAGEAMGTIPADESVGPAEVRAVEIVEEQGEIAEPDAIAAESSDEDVQQPTSRPSDIPQSIPADSVLAKSSSPPTYPTPPRSTLASPAPESTFCTELLASEPLIIPEEATSFPSPTNSKAPSAQSTVPNTPSASLSPLQASPPKKRKRSSTSASPPRLEIPSVKKAKKVSWAPELVDVERPHMAPPQFVSEDELYSPVDDEANEEDKVVARVEDGVESGVESDGEEALDGLFGSDDETSDEEDTETEADKVAAGSYIVDDLVSVTDEADEERQGMKFAVADAVEDLVDWADDSE